MDPENGSYGTIDMVWRTSSVIFKSRLHGVSEVVRTAYSSSDSSQSVQWPRTSRGPV